MRAAIIALALVACGSSTKQRQDTIVTTGKALNAAKAGFFAFDAGHDMDIVTKATSHDEGVKQLAAYQAKRAKFNADLYLAYDAFVVAVTLADDKSINGMVEAAAIVAQDLAALGVK